ncbi:hypothetical protein G3O06_20515 [Burkholderia sp. Ac-20345]|uniref:Gp37 family protein n=1 Tax=Burkholderia sp. Ac-20345 TaxID=2703891 RepID=UPI00197BC570|nr:Gp37 family protein [Burkholderia sp. Ac-20345]MBN3779923.1 hypothetical protein [Burkholderia sp. Ac-20345]
MIGLIKEIEDGLLAQLTAAFTKMNDERPWLKVESWPVRPEGYKMTGAGDVLIIYRGGSYKVRSTSEMFYDDDLKFEIVIRARTLRDNDGAYEMLEAAFGAVCGHRLPQSADVTVPLRDDFVDYGEGVFAYSLMVCVPVLIVKGRDDAAPSHLGNQPEAGAFAGVSFNRQ